MLTKENEDMTNLQNIRLKNGLSQSQLAKKSVVPRRTIQAYEIDFRDINKADMTCVFKLCNALGCLLQEILTDESLIAEIDTYMKS